MNKFQRFTYGDQFSPDDINLTDLLKICIDNEGDRYNLQKAIRNKYFEGHGKDPLKQDENSEKMAMNCLLSLNGYKLIKLEDKGKSYIVTDFSKELLSCVNDQNEIYRSFARHIIMNLDGLLLARLVENIHARGEQVTLEYLGEELNDLGIKIPPNSTYISTMRAWLAKAKVFHSTGYEVNWDVIYDLLKIDKDFIDEVYQLESEQKYFLLSLINLDVKDFTPSNKIAKHTRSVYKIRLTTKNLVKDILEPLESLGLINTRKTTSGRGAKPHDVCLTEKSINKILQPLINNLASLTDLTPAELNRTFESVVADLDNEDKHVKGIALELFSVWIIRLLGLRFSGWRVRHYQSTGSGEVDVMAASDKIIYNRWQIQCKNQKSTVGINVIAKEVGLTFVTKADIVAIVTTSQFARDAVNYADMVTNNSRYYIILIDGEDIQRIVRDKSVIIDILNTKARRAFARKELGISEFDDELYEKNIDTVDGLEKIIEQDS